MKYRYFLASFCLLFGCKHEHIENVQLSAFSFIPFEKITNLSSTIEETSGITKDGEAFWTLNDGGNSNEIFKIDSQGKIIHRVKATGSKNTDWEELTADSTHLFIGNFGNNVGTRKDLKIYGLSLDSLSAKRAKVQVEINFNYTDQKVFPGTYDHNFDCEAMISYGDSLYLFSKSWKDEDCMIYRLPKSQGSYGLSAIDRFDTKGVITAAAISPKEDRLCLLGYNFTAGVFDPFIWIFSDFEGSDFFDGQSVRYNMDSKRQMEAVDWVDDSTLYITAEGEGAGSASLFKIVL